LRAILCANELVGEVLRSLFISYLGEFCKFWPSVDYWVVRDTRAAQDIEPRSFELL